MTKPSETIENKKCFKLNPELGAEFCVPLKSGAIRYPIRFSIMTEHNQFAISHVPKSKPAKRIMTISFKQIQSGNLNSNYTPLWYKLKGALFSIIERWHPNVRITKDKLAFAIQFKAIFNAIAKDIIPYRVEIDEKLGPLPYAIWTLLEFKLPRTKDGLYIINGNALSMYNAKARAKKWVKIRNVNELAFYVSQSFPALKFNPVRKQYWDINAKYHRRMVLSCDLDSVAREIERVLGHKK